MKRCVKCIMPDTVPGVSFDQGGVCSLCRDYVPPSLLGEGALRELLAQAKPGRGGYDSLVPVSGGRDSTYVLYLAKAEYGLNPLAVNYNNGFQNPQALKNVEAACRALGVDLVIVRSKRDVGVKIARACAKASVPRGLSSLASSLCRHCPYGYRSAAYIEAERREIPVILWGTSAVESTAGVHGPALGAARPSKWSQLLSLGFYRTEYQILRQRLEFPVPGNPRISRAKLKLHDPGIREVKVFDYVPWERQKIKRTIMEQLGWAKPADHVSSWRTDCTMHETVNFLFAKILGCTKDGLGYCNMINEGQMTREEALAQEEHALATPWDHVERFLAERLRLSQREVARVKALQEASPYQHG